MSNVTKWYCSREAVKAAVGLAGTKIDSLIDSYIEAASAHIDGLLGIDIIPSTKAAGALAEADDGSETALDVTDASLIDVGDTILIGTEEMFISGRAPLDTTGDLNDTLTASASDVTVTVTDGTLIKQGEVILIESERMLVESITGNDLTVQRGYDGSVLAAHSGALNIYAFRTLTVVRAVNGTIASSHAISTAITKYVPPADIMNYCRAKAIAMLKQGESGWTGQIGGTEGAINLRNDGLKALEDDLVHNYGVVTL